MKAFKAAFGANNSHTTENKGIQDKQDIKTTGKATGAQQVTYLSPEESKIARKQLNDAHEIIGKHIALTRKENALEAEKIALDESEKFYDTKIENIEQAQKNKEVHIQKRDELLQNKDALLKKKADLLALQEARKAAKAAGEILPNGQDGNKT